VAVLVPAPQVGGGRLTARCSARAAGGSESGEQARGGEPQQLAAMEGGTHLRHRTKPPAPEMQLEGSASFTR
jgi:hypothetical protein